MKNGQCIFSVNINITIPSSVRHSPPLITFGDDIPLNQIFCVSNEHCLSHQLLLPVMFADVNGRQISNLGQGLEEGR